MSALVRLLYPPPVVSRSASAIVGWWERRRLRFNLIVGGAGLVTLGTVTLFSWLPPLSQGTGIPLGVVVAYGILANLFYTVGWISEIAFNAWWKDDPPPVGPLLFRQGLLFSIGLTLLPIGLAAIGWLARVVRAVI
jgi:hypothetical protein